MSFSAGLSVRKAFGDAWYHDGGRKGMMTKFGAAALVLGILAAFDVYRTWTAVIGLLFLGLAMAVFSTYVVRVALILRDGYRATTHVGLYGRMGWFVSLDAVGFVVCTFVDGFSWMVPLVGFGAGAAGILISAFDFALDDKQRASTGGSPTLTSHEGGV